MERKLKYKISFVLIIAVVAVLLISSLGTSGEKDALYTVTADQWQEAFGDKAHIQTIYRNVTIEINEGETGERMLLATSNGSLLLDNETLKHICISTENGFMTYIYYYSSQKWDSHNFKDDGVDETLNTRLPGYVDMAMSGLQGEFERASYNDSEKCYIISHPMTGGNGSEMMNCKVYFENGQLIRLETEITSAGNTLTLKLYDIGKTKVQAPAEYKEG
jgi:hypothetical protein